jgi:hypothetical protein
MFVGLQGLRRHPAEHQTTHLRLAWQALRLPAAAAQRCVATPWRLCHVLRLRSAGCK